MGSSELKKILPVFDMLLLLVLILFSTAGFVRSLPPAGSPEEPNQNLLKEYENLKQEMASKEELANNLDEKLQALNKSGSTSIEKLQATLSEAESRRQQLTQTEKNLTEVRGRLDQLTDRLNTQKIPELLKDQIEALKQKIQQLEQEKEALKKEVTGIDLNEARARELQQEINKLEQEIKQLVQRIKELEAKAKPSGTGGWPSGDYNGPYILLECDDKGVVVYPGARRIALSAPERDIEWLKDQVKMTGAAALVARPTGFNESYSKFFKILTEFATEEKNRGNKIILSFWPIGQNEPISKYMPSGGAI